MKIRSQMLDFFMTYWQSIFDFDFFTFFFLYYLSGRSIVDARKNCMWRIGKEESCVRVVNVVTYQTAKKTTLVQSFQKREDRWRTSCCGNVSWSTRVTPGEVFITLKKPNCSIKRIDWWTNIICACRTVTWRHLYISTGQFTLYLHVRIPKLVVLLSLPISTWAQPCRCAYDVNRMAAKECKSYEKNFWLKSFRHFPSAWDKTTANECFRPCVQKKSEIVLIVLFEECP